MTIYSKPITLSDISKITGVKSKRLGYMVQNGSYNENSLYKPVRFNSFAPLTEEQRKAVNYGWYIPLYNSFDAMKIALTNGETFRYQKPRGLNYVENGQTYQEQFRMQDFNGYDSNATSPFILNIESSASVGGSVKFSFATRLIELLTWAEWEEFTGIDDLYVGIYIPEVGYYPITYYRSGHQIGNRLEEEGVLSIPLISNYFTAGQTYNCYLVLTTWSPSVQQWHSSPSSNEGDSGKSWWAIVAKDTIPPKFTVAPAYNPINGVKFNTSNAVTSYRFDRENGLYVFSNTSFDYSLQMENYSGELTPYVSVRFVVKDVYPGVGTTLVEKEIGHVYSTAFPQGTTINGTISYPDDIKFLTEIDSLRIEARIILELKSVNAPSDYYYLTEVINI